MEYKIQRAFLQAASSGNPASGRYESQATAKSLPASAQANGVTCAKKAECDAGGGAKLGAAYFLYLEPGGQRATTTSQRAIICTVYGIIAAAACAGGFAQWGAF